MVVEQESHKGTPAARLIDRLLAYPCFESGVLDEHGRESMVASTLTAAGHGTALRQARGEVRTHVHHHPVIRHNECRFIRKPSY